MEKWTAGETVSITWKMPEGMESADISAKSITISDGITTIEKTGNNVTEATDDDGILCLTIELTQSESLSFDAPCDVDGECIILTTEGERWSSGVDRYHIHKTLKGTVISS